jgi:uncharacterized protein YegL
LVQFSGDNDSTDEGDALALGTGWISVADAIGIVQGLDYGDNSGTGNYTNYDAALDVAQSAFGDPGITAGGTNVSYFLSDGVPTIGSGESGPGTSGGDGIGPNEETAWKNFLNTNDITSYALGIGTGATQEALNPIAWDGTNESEMNSIVVTQESELGNVLEDTIGDVIPPPDVAGNLLTNSMSGADQWAGEVDAAEATVTIIKYDNVNYFLNSADASITLNLDAAGSVTIYGNGDYTWSPGSSVSEDITAQMEFTVKDGDGDTDTGLFTLTLEDSGPIAVDDAYSVGIDSNNIVLVLDTSGSMEGERLALAKAALENLINTYGNTLNKVMLVEFNSDASVINVGGEVWLDGADAITEINNLDAGGWTDYDHAIQVVEENYGTPPSADNTFVYFLSDGEPTSSDDGNPNTISDAERGDWVDFLNTEDVNEVYAVGIGSGISETDSDLQQVAWSSSGDHEGNVVLVLDENDLSDTLQNLAQTVTGNVLDNDSDPDGDPLSVTAVDGIALDGDPGTDDVFNLTNGDLAINEDGDFTFTPDPDVNATQTFEYTVDDGHGNTDIGEVSIDIDTLVDDGN